MKRKSSLTIVYKNVMATIFILFSYSIIAVAQNASYTFNGNGNWSDSANWLNNLVPPNILPSGSEIIIAPKDSGICVLNIPQIITNGAILTVKPDKKFILEDALNISDPTKDSDDTLSKDITAHLDTISVPNPALQQILGYDGNNLGRSLGNQGILGNLIDGMLRYAQSLSEQKKTHPYVYEGTYMPEHMGLVYSFGQRTLSARLQPPSGDKFHTKYYVFGTDCSGLMYNLLKHEGVNLPLPVRVATFESRLKFALNNNITYKSIKVEKLKCKIVDNLKSGDFILWRGHIGIICDVGILGKIVFQSNGTGSPGSEDEQTKNINSVRGVHPIDFIKATSEKYWGSNYEILRLVEAFTDPRDGQVYPYKQIGTQVWMTKNLNVSTYRNGDPIQQVTGDGQWPLYGAGWWCYYNFDLANGSIYGKLYNFYAITDPRGLAPVGWHLPNQDEWDNLSTFLGGKEVAGGSMKSNCYWNSPNTGATNSSGFNGLPGGLYDGGLFLGEGRIGEIGIFYGGSSIMGDFFTQSLLLDGTGNYWGLSSYNYGVSVRCIKD